MYARLKAVLSHKSFFPYAASALLIVVIGIYIFIEYYIPPQTIVLRSDGFHPKNLVIEPGQTVTFINKSANAFWPASNSHPQHDLYPEFDSGHPIPSGDIWTFTFNREGKWGYHDHLRSFYTGYVIVGKNYIGYDCTADLAHMDVAKKRVCWSEKLRDELQTHGAKAAFTLFKTYYASDKDFTTIGCHLMAHQLGDDAYGEYLRYGKDLSKLQFPPESVYCGYGYYHGILEHMIRDNPDYAKADAFCKDLIREYEGTVPRIRLNCYHAIGHGFVPEPTDAEQWGNVQLLTAPALEACRKIPELDAQVECMQGTFNVIGDWMWNNQFGLSFPKNDSLSLCRSFSDNEVARACYYELSMRLLPFAGDNLVTVYEKYVASIPNDDIAGMVINSAAAGLLGAHISEATFIPFLRECRALPERVQEDCLKGLSGGFVAHGEPGKEYIKALAFCGDDTLTETEQDICFENTIRTFKGSYTKEKVADICTSIPEAYQHYCAYSL